MKKNKMNFAQIEHEAMKIDALSEVDLDERRDDNYTRAVKFFRRPAYQYTELEAKSYEELSNGKND